MADIPLVTTISKEQDCVTLINTFFTNGHEDQDKLIKILVDATEEVMRYQPGFITANFHRSYDGSAVTNYAQWHSTEHWKVVMQKPEVQEHIKITKENYERKTALYQVMHISHAVDSTICDPISLEE
jgi:quinol monooxygenase YgiN